MKIGSLEGTPQEIKDYIESIGFKAEDYIEKPRKEIKALWIIISIASFIIVSSIIWVYKPLPIYIDKILTISDFILILWIASVVHLKYKNYFVTVLALLFTLIILSFCCEFISVRDGINKIMDKVK